MNILTYHGYKPQRKLWKHFAASYWVLYPPLRGIVQLTNSAAPIVTFRLFAFGIGVSRINKLSSRDVWTDENFPVGLLTFAGLSCREVATF